MSCGPYHIKYVAMHSGSLHKSNQPFAFYNPGIQIGHSHTSPVGDSLP